MKTEIYALIDSNGRIIPSFGFFYNKDKAIIEAIEYKFTFGNVELIELNQNKE